MKDDKIIRDSANIQPEYFPKNTKDRKSPLSKLPSKQKDQTTAKVSTIPRKPVNQFEPDIQKKSTCPSNLDIPGNVSLNEHSFQNQNNQSNNDNSVDKEPTEPNDDDQSASSQDSFEEFKTVKEANCHSLFLLKLGFEFSLYYLVMFAMVLFILLDVRNTRIMYRAMYLNIWLWIFLGLSLSLKVVLTFIGSKIRIVLKFLFFLDAVMSAFFIVGLFYWLQEKGDTAYYSYSPFVVVYIFNLLVASFLFTVSTFYHSKKYRYNFMLGAVLMTTGTCATSLGLFYGWKSVVTITIYQFIWIMVIMAGHNLYMAINAYFLVKYRDRVFLRHDSVLAFYCFWTDLFFMFWKDLFLLKKHKNNKMKVKFINDVEVVGVETELVPVQKVNKKGRERDPNEITSSVASKKGRGQSEMGSVRVV